MQWGEVTLALPAVVGVAQADGAVIDALAGVRRAGNAVRMGRAHGAGFVGSLTMGAGQFCTKPGIAFVPTVVPWKTLSIWLGSTPAVAQIAFTPLMNPCAGLDGVDGVLSIVTVRRSRSASTRSVKVPPTSTPKAIIAISRHD